MRRSIDLLILSGIMAACATAPVAPDSVAKSAETHASASGNAEHFAGWLTGHFDNHLQTLDDQADEVKNPHGRVHSVFVPVTNLAVGEHLRYVEQYSDEDPTKVYRRRLYRISDEPDGQILLEIASFQDEAVTVGAVESGEKLSALGADQLQWKSGCEVRWSWRDDHYIGATTRGACRVPSRKGGTLLIEDDLKLSATDLWIQDRAHDESGARVFGHPEGIPHKLKRAAVFKGWAAMRDPAQPKKWIGCQPIVLHDQGSEVQVKAKDGTPLPYVVRLAQRVYRATKTPILKFTVRAPGETRFKAYTWTEPDGSKVGVNLGDFQTGMTRQP